MQEESLDVTSPAAPRRAAGHGCAAMAAILVGGLLLGGVIVIFTAFSGFSRFRDAVEASLAGQRITNASLAVLRNERQAFLVTRRITVESIVEETNVDNLGSTARVLYIANGQAAFGFDVSKITARDIEYADKVLRVTVPPPRLYQAWLNMQKSRVYDKQDGWTNWKKEELEDAAIRRAEMEVRAKAERLLGEEWFRHGAAMELRSLLEERLLNAFPGVHRVQVRMRGPRNAASAAADSGEAANGGE